MPSASSPYQLEATMASLLSSHRFSLKWYQGDRVRIGFAILITILGYLSVLAFRLHPPLSLSVLSLSVLFLGVLADVVSTHRLTLVKRYFDARDLNFPFREANPLLSDIPSLRELIWGKPSLLAVVTGIVTFFVPLVGWGVAASLFAVSLNNNRNRQHALYQLRLYDSLIAEGGDKIRDTRIRGISVPSRPILARDSKGYASLA